MQSSKASPQKRLDSDVQALQTLPLDQLEQEVLDAAARVSAHVGGAENFADSMGLGVGGKPTDAGLEDDNVREASERLVSAGLLGQPTDTVTRDLRKVLQAVADQHSPGLYDVMSDDKDLTEVLEGVANGSWGIGGNAAPADQLGATDY